MTTADDTATRTREIAYQLLVEGTNPSWRAVRERLGKGSSATINAALKEFWAEIRQRLSRPELPPAVADLCHALWQRALDESDQRWTDEREGFQRELATARDALATSATKHEVLVKEVERSRAKVEERDRQLAEASKREQKLIQNLDRARQAQSAAEKSAGEALSRERAREKDHQREIERVREELRKRDIELAGNEERWRESVKFNERERDRFRETETEMVALREREREAALARERAEAEAEVLREQMAVLLERVGGG